MKDKILKSKDKAIVTFVALAVMGSGVLFATMPVSADDGAGHPHFMGKQFRGFLSDKDQHHIGPKFSNLSPEAMKQHREHHQEARKHRTGVISEFLGISPEELRNRVEEGERIHDIVEEKGKTRADFRAYMMDYMRKHHLFDS